jgi:dihydroxy-acid dehydratase
VHLSAIAGRTPHAIDLAAFDKLGREVPVLVDLKPSGDHYMEHFHNAGGTPRLMAELKDLLALDAKTVTGGTLADAIAGAQDVPGQTVIRSRAAPSSSNRRLPPSSCGMKAGRWCSIPSRI